MLLGLKSSSWTTSTSSDISFHSYIEHARPPPMPLSSTAPKPPLAGHRSHQNHLQVEPNPRRKLQNIHLLHDEFLAGRVCEFIDLHVPATVDASFESCDPESGERLSIPCPPLTNQMCNLGRVADVESTHRWVNHYPIQTLQRLMHAVFPQSMDYRFSDLRRPDLDEDIMKCSIWSRHRNSLSAPSTSAVVFVQPPWILSWGDFESFVRCSSLLNTDPFKTTFSSDERLWAKIWDVSFQQKSRFFIVTTYWGWVWGAFSRAWTNGFVTRHCDFRESSPTILESSLYWLASAMELEGSWQVPEVPEPVQNFGMEASGLIPLPPPNRLVFAPSDSDWSREKYSDTASQTTVTARKGVTVGGDSVVSVSESSDPSPYRPASPESTRTQSVVSRWLTGVSYSATNPPGSYIRHGSPAPTQCSASTIQNQSDLSSQGAWLSGNPAERTKEYGHGLVQ